MGWLVTLLKPSCQAFREILLCMTRIDYGEAILLVLPVLVHVSSYDWPKAICNGDGVLPT
jgi:hypothetical protein